MFIFHPFRYGIASKKEFWVTSLWLLLFTELVAFFMGPFCNEFMKAFAAEGDIGPRAASFFMLVLVILLALAYLYVLQVSIRVKRLHDAGYSGWWVILVQVVIYVLQTLLGKTFIHQDQVVVSALSLSTILLSGLILLGVNLIAIVVLGFLPTKTTNNPYRDKALRRSKSEFKELKL
ncbi:MAG: DUF805 domain-containing protein [Neisseriaceae bacterium]